MEKARKSPAPRTAAAKKTTPARARSPRKSASAPAVVALTHEQIAARAHELFVSSGHQHGRDEEFWLEAERQLRTERLAS